MDKHYMNEPMLEMFLFESTQLIEQLEQNILAGEKESSFTIDNINEIFRIMHTIKGSSAMMMFQGISTLAHSMEDIFYFLRERKPEKIDYSALSDLVLEGVDFIKLEIEKIKHGSEVNGDPEKLRYSLKEFLSELKQDNALYTDNDNTEHLDNTKQQYYISHNKTIPSSNKNVFQAVITFEEGCEMENIRAYTLLHNLKDITDEIVFFPEDIIDDDSSIEVIRREGFHLLLKCNLTYELLYKHFMQTIFLKDLDLIQLDNDDDFKSFHMRQEKLKIQDKKKTVVVKNSPIKIPEIDNLSEGTDTLRMVKEPAYITSQFQTPQQSIISVSVSKLDRLMDLVGEMVIAEAMVIQNPDLKDLELENFLKAARQLNKITSEMQDLVMAIRMVPLSATFHKMHRIVRDMSKKLCKEVNLEIIGEDTEVDKNIIEHIADPIMHLVRNSIDHGIETPQERLNNGKPKVGTIILEAKNIGSDVMIIIKDDGKGLNKDKILRKARDNNLLYKPVEDMTDKEIFNLILLPGFSTKEEITEFSGRGVGMDVVLKNIETIAGSVVIDSMEGKNMTVTLKLPLTLAIIDGMNVKVGDSTYTIPTNSIKESFRPKENDIITDPDGNEMIMVRGICYPILRLHEYFKVKTEIAEFTNGIIIIVEQDEKTMCFFADELIGQQQVVVKALPNYILSIRQIKGLAGCTLLGDGSISLIVDIAGLFNTR